MHRDNDLDFSPWVCQDASMPFLYKHSENKVEKPNRMTEGMVKIDDETLTINKNGEVVDVYGNFLFYAPFEGDKEWEKTIIRSYNEYLENCE